jgi:hypothetical protein
MKQKINITSKALEKGIDLAKDFLDKLIMPSVEETGLLLKDKVTLWRVRNQIRMLNQAELYIKKNNISTKTISLKLLSPLLDYSGLEEEEILQDKWAILLSNMVDSEQNIENHVFPYILSQLSSNEFQILENAFNEKQIRILSCTSELEEFRKNRPEIEEELKSKIEQLDKTPKSPDLNEVVKRMKEKSKYEYELRSLKYRESSILFSMTKSEILPFNLLKEFELSNLIRLGVVKEEKDFYADSQTLNIPKEEQSFSSYISVDVDIDVKSNVENILTELGELFISACKEKTKIED